MAIEETGLEATVPNNGPRRTRTAAAAWPAAGAKAARTIATMQTSARILRVLAIELLMIVRESKLPAARLRGAACCGLLNL
jgi:hypothetical protein